MKMKMLLVDDQDGILVLYSPIFEEMGYEVVTCNNGSEAIDWIWQNHEKPDIIVTDLDMPAFNGLQVLNQAYERYGKIPAIIMTGGFRSHSESECRKITSHVIHKPFLPDELIALVDKVLAEASPRSEKAVEKNHQAA